MNKHSSVLWLMIQSTFTKIVGLLAGMVAVEFVLFWQAVLHMKSSNYGLEQAISQGRIPWVAAAGLILMTALLCLTGAERSGGRTGYTLQRLAISEKSVFVWQAVYNASCYLLLWAVQVVAAVGLGHLYMKIADPAMVTGQTIFLAFYRSEFLHSLLPMAEMTRWLRNIALLVGLGMSSAYFTYAQRRRRGNGELLSLLGLTLLFFSASVGSRGNDRLLGLASLATIVMIWWAVYKKEAADET